MNLKEKYLQSHSDWREHYFETPYGAWNLAFKKDFMETELPKEKGAEDAVTIKLRDTEDNDKVYFIRWWLTYENYGRDWWIKDINYNFVKDWYSLADYTYGSKLCTCNIKALAKEAGAIVEDDECEGNRFIIESIVFDDSPELILYSEVFDEDELEKLLAEKPICEYCKEPKVQSEYLCPGDDQCIYGEGGKASLPCEGWGRYCCRCGADYARGQLP